MNKAYSNKALPMGTVHREWRKQEVNGVGGLGIVKKAQGKNLKKKIYIHKINIKKNKAQKIKIF
jgi:hypothetical protein